MVSPEAKHKEAEKAADAAGGRAGAPSSSSRLSRLLGRFIFYALLALLPLTALPYGTVEYWSIALFELLVFLLGALWMAEGALGGGSWLRKEHALLLAPLALASLYAYLQSVIPAGTTTANVAETLSADPYESRLFALRLFALATFAALLLRYTTSRRRLAALVAAVLCVGVASALFGILRQTTQREDGFLLPFLLREQGYAQFVGRNSFAFLMEMCLGLGLGLLFGVPRQRILLVLAALLPVWTALVLCNSRGGILSMLAQVFFAALLYYLMLRPARRQTAGGGGDGRRLVGEPMSELPGRQRLFESVFFKGALVLALLVVTVTGTLWMGGSPLADRLETVSGELSPEAQDPARTGASRRDIWRSTLNLIKSHPLAGSGLGAYWIAISQHHEGSGALTPQQAHNDYLELTAGGGLIGLLLFLSFIYLFVRQARARIHSPAASVLRAARIGALIGLFGVAVHSLMDFGLHVTVNACACLALVAVATAQVADAQGESGAGDARPRR